MFMLGLYIGIPFSSFFGAILLGLILGIIMPIVVWLCIIKESVW